MRLNILIVSFFVLGFLFSCQGESEKQKKEQSLENLELQDLSGSLMINGAYSLYPLFEQWAEDFESIYPEVSIQVEKNGTAHGMSTVFKGMNNLSMISRDLTPEEENKGIWKVPVAKDGVVPIINRENPFMDQIKAKGLKAEQLVRMFTVEDSYDWGDIMGVNQHGTVNVLMREEGSGATEVWANFLWLSPEQLRGKTVHGDDEMIKQIQNDNFSIGYANLVYVFNTESGTLSDNIEILPIDFNQNGRIDSKECPCGNLKEIQRAIWLGKYPRNLCRTLYLLSRDKPTDKLTVAFIRWILTEGQEKVEKMGYSSLNNVQIECALKSLE